MSSTTDQSNSAQAAYDLFERWLDMDDAARALLIERTRKENPDMHRRLRQLIDADRGAERLDFLAGSAVEDAAAASREPALNSERSGQRIGNWALERSLGAGGMGQVWLARRCDGLHQGHAAIKMLRVVVADAHANERFALEGRILARLTHPHIAMLLDAGITGDGQRYLVLEYVDGERIDAWCDSRKLDIRARLNLFLQVCAAVSYAHSNLIVHRDLKPSNILVLKDGTAKLLDFGIAKLLESDGNTATQLTGEAAAAMTPGYAAPEQIAGGAITTATDVYALGVILYGLLGGHSPYGRDDLRPMQLARAVVESEPRRLSDTVAGADAARIAAQRASKPERLRRFLRGDLDVITSKALKKNPAERYASVQALADDVRRHLDHLPISARADRATYRIGKFVQRHWIGVTATTIVMVAIAMGLTGVMWQANRAKHEAERAVAVKRFLLDMFDQARTDTQKMGLQVRETTVNSMLVAGADNIERSFASQPDIRDEVFQILASLYSDSFDPKVAIQLARRRLDDATSAFGSADPRIVPAEIGLADALLTSGDDTEATSLLAHGQSLLDRVGDDSSLIRARLLRWQGILTMVHRDKTSWQQHPLRRSIELLRARYPREDELIQALVTLPAEACRFGHVEEALDSADELYRLSVSRYGVDNVYVDSAALVHGQLLVVDSRAEDAIVLLEQAQAGFKRHLGEKNQNVLLAQLDLSEAYWLAGRRDDSRAIFANVEQAAAADHAGEKQVEAMLTTTRASLADLAAGKQLHRCGR
jgi:eukaryotic-like serine/threonine-protein kinase